MSIQNTYTHKYIAMKYTYIYICMYVCMYVCMHFALCVCACVSECVHCKCAQKQVRLSSVCVCQDLPARGIHLLGDTMAHLHLRLLSEKNFFDRKYLYSTSRDSSPSHVSSWTFFGGTASGNKITNDVFFLVVSTRPCTWSNRAAAASHLLREGAPTPPLLCTFWLANVLRATTACNFFSTLQSHKIGKTQ